MNAGYIMSGAPSSTTARHHRRSGSGTIMLRRATKVERRNREDQPLGGRTSTKTARESHAKLTTSVAASFEQKNLFAVNAFAISAVAALLGCDHGTL
jgi:hypothetical protein